MILIAPTAYKGTIGAAAAAAALARGAGLAAPAEEVVRLPLSDGGPGLLDALLAQPGAHARIETVDVSGPLGEPVTGRVLRRGRRAVVESADACGLALVAPSLRDPLRASTEGVGELLLAARGGEEIVLGLGGSATVDGGSGMARSLGWRFLDARGRDLAPGGGELHALARIVRPEASPALGRVTALADVDNPLCDPRGAARVFGPQKGADAAGVERLEEGLARLAERIEADLGVRVAALPGAGAAGGLGAGAVAFAGAALVGGSGWVLDAVAFDEKLATATLVVTGEGAWDEQSGMGKITGEVVRRARERNVPVLLVCGRVRAPVPTGVFGVDGGGELLTPRALEALAAAGCARLLGR